MDKKRDRFPIWEAAVFRFAPWQGGHCGMVLRNGHNRSLQGRTHVGRAALPPPTAYDFWKMFNRNCRGRPPGRPTDAVGIGKTAALRRRAILESPLRIEMVCRKKGPPRKGRPKCLEMFFPIRRAETSDWSGGFTRVTSSKTYQTRVCLPALPGQGLKDA